MIKRTFIAIVTALAVLPAAASAQTSCRSLVITGHPAYMPVAWADKGAIVGAAPELVASIVRDLGGCCAGSDHIMYLGCCAGSDHIMYL